MFDTAPTAAAERAARLLLRPMRPALTAARDRMLDDASPEGPHGMRVALRRLRAMLWLLRPAVAPATHDVLAASARSLMTACGPVRDLDVLLAQTLPDLDKAASLGPRRLAAFARTAAPIRAERLARARAAAAGPAWAGLENALDDLLDADEGRFADRRDHSALADVAATRLEKRDRRVRKALRRFDALHPRERHELRLDVKRLRYAVEASATLFDGADARSYIEAATALQALLGADNDAAGALEALRSVVAQAEEPARHGPLVAAVEEALAAGDGRKAAARLEKAARRLRKAKRVWRKDGDDGG